MLKYKWIKTGLLIFIAALFSLLAACTSSTPSPTPRFTSTPRLTSTPVKVAATRPATATSTPTRTPAPAATRTSTSTSTSTPTPTPGVTRLVVWASLPGPQAEALAEDLETFQEEFPQYRLILRHYDSPQEFMAALSTEEVDFDVILASPLLLGDLWAKKQLAALSNFFPPDFIDSFAAVTLQGAQRAGETWGLADTAGFHLLLFYNLDLVETPPANTEELFDLAESLTQEGAWGLALNSYDPLWLIPWLLPSRSWLTNQIGRPTLDTPEMETALSLYLSWQDRAAGIAPVVTYEEARSQFLAGKVAMLIDGEWALEELARTNRVNWRAAQLPRLGQAETSQPAAPLVLARYWAVNRSVRGNQALAAAAFLEHVTRPERQLAWTVQFGLLPTHREALDDLIIANDSALRTSAEQMLEGQTVPLGVDPNALLEAMREPLRGALEGELTPKQAVELMQANAERE